MAKYQNQSKQLSEWLKKALIDMGDGEPRDLRQLIAKGGVEGFKAKSIIEMLQNYRKLGGVNFNEDDNMITSFLNLKNVVIAKKEGEEAKKEADFLFRGEPIKEEEIKQEPEVK